jgi:hypothetical protein
MKYKKKSEIPEELQNIIDAVNLLPQDLESFEKNINELYVQFDREYLEAIKRHDNRIRFGYEPLENDWAKIQLKYNEKLCQIVKSNLLRAINYEPERNSFQNAVLRLRRLINEKQTLLTIVDAYRTWNFSYDRQTIYPPDFNFKKPLIAFSFNPDSTIKFTSFEILELLKINNIPIDRIRICQICRNIFWAKRIESPTCSKRCSNTFNGRKTRIKQRAEKYLQQYNEQLEKLEKLKTSFNPDHPLIQKQKKLLNNLLTKLDKEKLKYGTLQTPGF